MTQDETSAVVISTKAITTRHTTVATGMALVNTKFDTTFGKEMTFIAPVELKDGRTFDPTALCKTACEVRPGPVLRDSPLRTRRCRLWNKEPRP